MKFLKISVIFLVAVVLISGCIQSDNPVDILKLAQEKSSSLNYILEYKTILKTTLDQQHLEQNFRTVVTKSGKNKKIQIYADEIVILQEIIENEIGTYVCSYGKSIQDINCILTEKSLLNISEQDLLKKSFEKGLLKFDSSTKIVEVNGKNRECDLIKYSFDFDKLKTEDFADIVPIQSFDAGLNLKDIVKEMTASACLDKETGISLETESLSHYQIPEENEMLEYNEEKSEKITRLSIDPLISRKEFEIPEDAEVEFVGEE